MGYYASGGGGGGGGGGWSSSPSWFDSIVGTAKNAVFDTAQQVTNDPAFKAGKAPYNNTNNNTSAPAYDANEIRALDSQKSLYERLIQSADSTLESGLSDIDKSYNKTKTRATEDKTSAFGDLDYKLGETEKGREKSLNTVGDNSRTLRNSLMRILGMASGGGSAFDIADKAVARDATKNRTGVLEDYASNFRGLGREREDTEKEYKRIFEDVDENRLDSQEKLRAAILAEKQSLAGILGQIEADKARIMGGDQFAAADPYRQQYLDYQNRMDALPGQYSSPYSYSPANVKAATLKDYMVDRATINGAAPGKQTQYSPYSNFLKRDEDEQRLA